MDRFNEIIHEIYYDLFEQYEGVPFTSHMLHELTKRYYKMSKEDKEVISRVIGGESI